MPTATIHQGDHERDLSRTARAKPTLLAPVFLSGPAFLAGAAALAVSGISLPAVLSLAVFLSMSSAVMACLRTRDAALRLRTLDQLLQGAIAACLLWIAQLASAGTLLAGIAAPMPYLIGVVFVVFTLLLVAEAIAACALSYALARQRGPLPAELAAVLVIDNRFWGGLGSLVR